MSQAGYTPIQLYYSTTAAATPSAGNLAAGELAVNITDGKLFYKDNGGVVQVLATKATGSIGGSNTQVQYNNAGALAGSANLTFDGTTLTANALTVSNAVTLSAGTANGVAYLNGSKVLTTGTGLQFDGSNLGLGVTPSAWASQVRATEINTTAGLASFSNGTGSQQTWLLNNAYFDSSFTWRYKFTGTAAMRYAQDSGQHQWFTAPSGTAGNPISFTQAMTLTSSGTLLVKTTTDTGAGVTVGPAASAPFGSSTGLCVFGNSEFQNALHVGGNLLVGTTSVINGGKLSVAGRLAIQNSASDCFTVNANGYGNTGYVFNSSASFAQAGYFNTSVGFAGAIACNNNTTTYATSSDYRLKDSVQPMTGALAKVAALKPVTYKWKVDGSVGEGFIAHELQAVCPNAVTGEKDAVNADGSPRYQGVDTSFLVATLTAAIQELKAEVDSLKARLALDGPSNS